MTKINGYRQCKKWREIENDKELSNNKGFFSQLPAHTSIP